jgi:hypothetical protein
MDKDTIDKIVLIAVLAGGFWYCVNSIEAHGQEAFPLSHAEQLLDAAATRADPIEQQLVNQTAAVALNEGGYDKPYDWGLVVQTVEGHGSNAAERLKWLRRHSAKVLGNKPCLPSRNCEWTRDLALAPLLIPSAFQGAKREWWALKRRNAWLYVRMTVAWFLWPDRDLSKMPASYRPCSQTPYSWGAPSDSGLHDAKIRGLQAVSCRSTVNIGYVLAVK